MRFSLLVVLALFAGELDAQVTYHSHIKPIIKMHCQSCHQDGEIGPMALETYKQVSSYGTMIKFVTDTKLMPPFKPEHNTIGFRNERKVTDEERNLISEWIDGGLLEGVSIKKRDEVVDKSIDQDYDYTTCMSESFEHYGIYYDQYQVFPITIDLPEDQYIESVVFEPGNKETVRSANISIGRTGTSKDADEWDPRYGFFAYGSLGFTTAYPNWYSWMPHTKGLTLKEKETLFLPKQSELLLHIHYGPFGEVSKDSSCLHFNFADKAGRQLQNIPFIHEALLADTFLLDDGVKNRISSSFELPIDVKLRSLTPLAHLLCRSWEVFAVLPDRSSLSLLSIKDWDFHWKEKYVFNDYVSLPKGTTIYTTAIYDNTIDNPYNPSDPPHTMKAGPHMFDENYVCYFELVPIDTYGRFDKPFSVTEVGLKELFFELEKEGKYTIKSVDMKSGNEITIADKFYPQGKHSIYSSDLPGTKGRHVIQLVDENQVIDAWWFIVL